MRQNPSRTRAEQATPAPRVRRPTRSPLERPLVPAIVAVALALSLALAGCLGGAGGEIVDPNAQGAPADGTVPEAREPALTVIDMSGELLAQSVGPVEGIGHYPVPSSYVNAGTVPSLEDENGTILIDFRPDLGPAAIEAWVCIGGLTVFGGDLMDPVVSDCDTNLYSTGQAVQLDATGLSGENIHVDTDDGAGYDTTYVLCVSVFEFQEAPDDYTAIVDGTCHEPAAVEQTPPSGPVPVEHPVSIDIAVPFHVFYVYSHRCAVDFIEVDGPIISVDVTATWDYSVPVVGENLELTIYNGTTIPQDPHTRFPQGNGIAQEEGPSPLSLDADVAAGNQVGLVVCDWSHVVVREGFDVHIEGSLRYLAPAPGAT